MRRAGVRTRRNQAAKGVPSPNSFAGLALWFRSDSGISTTEGTLADGNDFSSANWTKTNVSINGFAGDPDGGSNASLMTENNVNAAHNIRHTITGHANGLTTIRVRAKANGRNWLWIGDNSSDRAFFNISTGATGTLGANVAAASTTSLGNGWWLCEFRVNQTSANVDIGLGNADNSVSYTGDNASGAFLYQAEIQQRRVTQWVDRVSGSTLAQATGSQQPRLYTGGLGGQNRVKCNRANSSLVTIASGAPSQLADHSIFAVVQYELLNSSFSGICGIGNGTASSALGHVVASPVAWYGGSGLVQPQGGGIASATPYRFGKTVVGSNGATQGYKNGTTDGSVVNNTYGANTAFTIGAYEPGAVGCITGDVYEVVVYSRVLGASEISGLDSYFKGRYGL